MNPDAIVAEGEAIYFDSNLNLHELEWSGPKPWLGTSTVVRQSARDYAQRIIARQEYVQPREDGLWSFHGNTHAHAAIRSLTPYRECQTKVDLGAFDRIGHFDGVTFRDGADKPCKPDDATYATVEEHKCFASLDEADKIALAVRQASLYAADIETQLEQGNRRFPLAAFHDATWDPWAKPIERWPNGVEVTGFAVRICPRFGPGSITHSNRPIKVVRLSKADKGQVRNFYDRKCKSIHESAWLANSEEPARLWDHSPEGLLEFARRDLVTMAEGPIAEDLARWSKENLAADDARKRRDRAQSELKALMRRTGQRELTLANGTRISLVGDFGAPREPWVKISPPRGV